MPERSAKSNAAPERVATSAKKPHAPGRHSSPEYADQLAAPLLEMQQVLGNQAVQRMLRAHLIQAKLTINQPGDEYEREADRVADQVMRMELTDSAAPARDTNQHDSHVQRKCAECEEEERVQRKSDGGGPPAAPPIVDEVLGSPGQPLDESTRSFFEPRFGRDFSGVRLHTDSRAAESASAVNALAYATSHHMVFGHGNYAPDTASGKRLLAHELTHVVQQGGAGHLRRSVPGSEGAARALRADKAANAINPFREIGTNSKSQVARVSTLESPSIVAREVRTEDIQTLTDQQLASEHERLQSWLLQHRTGDQEYATSLDYMNQVEAEISRRSPARARAAAKRQQLIGFVEKGSAASALAGLGVLGPAELAFMEQFAEGIYDGTQEQPLERQVRIFQRFYNLYFDSGHWGDKLDYGLGLFKGIALGIWGEIKGIVDLIILLPKLVFRINKWVYTLPQRLLSPGASAKASALYDELSRVGEKAASEIKEFFENPVQGMRKLAAMFESFLAAGLEKAYDLGLGAVDSAFKFLERPFAELGEEIGKIIGWTIFQLVLLIGTDAIGNLITKGASLAARLIASILEKAVEILKGIGSFFGEVLELIETLGRTALKAFSKTLEEVKGLLRRVGEFVEELFGKAGEEAAAAKKVAPGGSRLGGPRFRGRLGEVTRFEEVERYPGKLTDLFPDKAVREQIYSRIETGDLSLRDFANMLGHDGAEQVYFRSSYGGRWVDHVFPAGDWVVLRESKNVSDFAVTAKVERQLAADLELLDRHPEAIVHWRISGNGAIDPEAYDLMEAMVEKTGGRFNIQLQDAVTPPFEPLFSEPTVH